MMAFPHLFQRLHKLHQPEVIVPIACQPDERQHLKPERLAAFNLSPSQVSAALAANNHLSALGNTKGNLTQVALTANTDLRSVEEFRRQAARPPRRLNTLVNPCCSSVRTCGHSC